MTNFKMLFSQFQFFTIFAYFKTQYLEMLLVHLDESWCDCEEVYIESRELE